MLLIDQLRLCYLKNFILGVFVKDIQIGKKLMSFTITGSYDTENQNAERRYKKW